MIAALIAAIAAAIAVSISAGVKSSQKKKAADDWSDFEKWKVGHQQLPLSQNLNWSDDNGFDVLMILLVICLFIVMMGVVAIKK